MSYWYARLRTMILLAICGGITLILPATSHAFPECNPTTNPDAQTYCDETDHPENFQGNDNGKLCVAEPADTTPDVEGGAACATGMVSPLENLIALFVEVDFDADPVAQPPRVDVDPNSLTDGSFIETVTLPPKGPGTYTVRVGSLFIGGMGMPQAQEISRKIVQVGEPDLDITLAEVKQRDEDLTPGITEDPDNVFTLTSAVLSSQTMNLCLGSAIDSTGSSVNITVTNDVTTPEGNMFSLTRTCPTPEQQGGGSGGDDMGGTDDGGMDDGGGDGGGDEEIFCEKNPICNINGTTGFFVSGIPLGHGSNEMEIVVENIVDMQVLHVNPFENNLRPLELCIQFYDQDGKLIEQVDGRPIRSDDVTELTTTLSFGACPDSIPDTAPSAANSCDLDEPRLCNDMDGDGIFDRDDPDNDNDGICDLPAPEGLEGTSVTCQYICDILNIDNCEDFLKYVDVGPCDTPSQSLCNYEVDGDVIDISRACVQKQNETLPIPELQDPDKRLRKVYEMCPAKNDENTFVFHLNPDDLNFPLGSLTFDAQSQGFTATAVRSFGYGHIHSMFDHNGVLVTDEVSRALAGHIPAKYLEVKDGQQGKLIDTIEEAINTDKFKQDVLLALFKPQAPSREAINDCEFVGPQTDRFRAFQIYDAEIGNIDITSLHLLNNNRLWLRMEIDGFRGYTEIFSVQCDEADCDGMEIEDGVLKGATFAPDEDFGVGILPLELAIEYMTTNVEMKLSKDGQGLTVTEVNPIPGHPLLNVIGANEGRLVKFRCDVDVARTSLEDGTKIAIDGPACEALETLNGMLGNDGLPETPETLTVSQQLIKTIESQLSCLTPKSLTKFLGDFETDALMQINLPVFGKEFSTEAFADLLKADLIFSPWGVSFQGGALILPAGTFPEGAPTEGRNGKGFMAALPDELKTPDFGFLSDDEGAIFDAIGAAMSIGKEINVMVKEETVNMILQAVNILMFDLLEKEPNFADANDRNIIDKFGLGAFVDSEQCFQLDEEGLLEAVEGDEKLKVCFPLRLRPDHIFGGLDLNGDGTFDDDELNTPLRLRIGMNRHLPPMVQFVSSSTKEGPTGRPKILLSLKIALSDLELAVFEDIRLDPDPVINLQKQIDEGLEPAIRSWCERYPEASPDCLLGEDVPIVRFRVDGAVNLWVEYTPEAEDGKIQVRGGFKPRLLGQPDGSLKLVPDQEASFLNVTMKENNTPYADESLTGTMQANLNGTTLNIYLFGADSAFSFEIPVTLPEDASCDDTSDDGEEDLIDILNDFGFESLGLEDPLLVLTAGTPRYLGVGFDTVFNKCGTGASGSRPNEMDTDPGQEPPDGDDGSGNGELEPDPAQTADEDVPGGDASEEDENGEVYDNDFSVYKWRPY